MTSDQLPTPNLTLVPTPNLTLVPTPKINFQLLMYVFTAFGLNHEDSHWARHEVHEELYSTQRSRDRRTPRVTPATAGVRIEPHRNAKARLARMDAFDSGVARSGPRSARRPVALALVDSSMGSNRSLGCESPWSPRTFESSRFVISAVPSREARFSVPRRLGASVCRETCEERASIS
jgi:hypothetical protein